MKTNNKFFPLGDVIIHTTNEMRQHVSSATDHVLSSLAFLLITEVKYNDIKHWLSRRTLIIAA